ncbi:MAG: hypothetical protein EOO60_01970 [Hymenobacter sp.]|nr:MAG: hypothetical protein EOO60_01970 [Hymenobacter sp.]
MAEKVITVVVRPSQYEETISEIDFPKVTAALAEGYTVKNIKEIVTSGGKTHLILVFTLHLQSYV